MEEQERKREDAVKKHQEKLAKTEEEVRINMTTVTNRKNAWKKKQRKHISKLKTSSTQWAKRQIL